MKTFIINGSPRKSGDTAFLISELKKILDHEVVEISAYRNTISPCIDCRACTKQKGCIIDDDMRLIYADDFDNIVIAAPIHMATLPAPVLGLASRLQAYYCARRFLKDAFHLKEKTAALILAGGGDYGPAEAIRASQIIFQSLNAKGVEKNLAFSLNTDNIPAREDADAIQKVREISLRLNHK